MEKLVYLDNGAMDQFFRNYGVNPGRSGYDLCMVAGSLLEETRKLLTELFNGTDPNRLIFASNASDALNLAIFGLLKEGDHAVTSNLEHNSVLRPLFHLSRYNGVEVDYVAFDSQGFVDPKEFAQRFKKNTRLAVINHGSNVIGTVQPVREIGELCREHGVTLVVDAAQSAGRIPIDMAKMNIDVVAFTGHKSLMGPMGIGGLYVGDGVKIRHTRAGGTGVRSAVRTHLDEYPYRLEYGTPNLPGIAGLNAGVKWLQKEGMSKVHQREIKLLRVLRNGLGKIGGVSLYCQDDLVNHVGILAFNVDGLEAQDTGTMLDVDYNIASRTGLHCAPRLHEQLGTDKIHGTVRLGLGPFNTVGDVESVICAVEDIACVRKKKKKC